MVELLLEHGANKIAEDGNGHQPLHLAAAGGHEAIVDFLLHDQV
jgi:ankyrin repeat protein